MLGDDPTLKQGCHVCSAAYGFPPTGLEKWSRDIDHLLTWRKVIVKRLIFPGFLAVGGVFVVIVRFH
jgi:hypothetical protein